ncbi:unnamed protein product [Sphagnum balticum]
MALSAPRKSSERAAPPRSPRRRRKAAASVNNSTPRLPNAGRRQTQDHYSVRVAVRQCSSRTKMYSISPSLPNQPWPPAAQSKSRWISVTASRPRGATSPPVRIAYSGPLSRASAFAKRVLPVLQQAVAEGRPVGCGIQCAHCYALQPPLEGWLQHNLRETEVGRPPSEGRTQTGEGPAQEVQRTAAACLAHQRGSAEATLHVARRDTLIIFYGLSQQKSNA